jgi:transcriptional regulator with XRE-family HTH domain
VQAAVSHGSKDEREGLPIGDAVIASLVDGVDGVKVRRMRRERYWTQAQLGTRAGVRQPEISLIETGRLPWPRCLGRLAAVLEVPVADLLAQPQPGSSQDDPPTWSAGETAAELGIERRQVYALIRAAKLEARQAGRCWRVDVASVRKLQATGMFPAPGPRGHLRLRREGQQRTQLALANDAGVNLTVISALETGHQRSSAGSDALAAALDSPVGLPPPWEPQGAVLRVLRREAGLAQADVAEAVGLSRPYLSVIECGWKWRPDLVAKLAAALGITCGELTSRLVAAPAESGRGRGEAQAVKPGQRAVNLPVSAARHSP